MPLDPSHSDTNFRRSVKKYLVDNLYTTDGVYIDFSRIYQTPTDGIGDDINEWIRFQINGLTFRGTTATGRVAAYLFTREDVDGKNIAVLRDLLVNYAIDISMTDGLARVPLYDETWTQIGSMILTVGTESDEERADDDTLYKFVNLYFTYAVK